MNKYNISVRTEIWNSDGTIFCDLGTMRWFGVDDEVVSWLAGSCKTTAFWLIDFPESTEKKSYTLKYQTIVTNEDGSIHTDTTELVFEKMTYKDMVRFERWAIDQLAELCDLFEGKKNAPKEETKPRNKLKQGLRWGTQILKSKIKR